MNRYPLDDKGMESIMLDIMQNDKFQKETILKLCMLLRNAMAYIEDEEMDWYQDAEKILSDVHARKIAFENLRFDQSNGHRTDLTSPYDAPLDAKKIAVSENYDPQMTEEELAVHFNEPLPKKKQEKKVDKMSLEEIESWEKKQDNSNDIYKISARVKNLARTGGGNLTDVGDMLCNTYTHVIKAFYDFSENIPDKETKIKLTDLIRRHEDMPGNFIAATHSGVTIKKRK